MNPPQEVAELIAAIPLGTSTGSADHKKYIVNRQAFNNGRSTKVVAEERGGKDQGLLSIRTQPQRETDFALHKASGAPKSRDFQRQITQGRAKSAAPQAVSRIFARPALSALEIVDYSGGQMPGSDENSTETEAAS